MKKVVYKGATTEQVNWRGNDDPRPLLVEGKVYDVKRWDEQSWHTNVYLYGVKGSFNSVSFEVVEE